VASFFLPAEDADWFFLLHVFVLALTLALTLTSLLKQ
jgi:hypothetical protein